VIMEGRFEVAAPREQVWRAITDPALMVGCIPGCESIEPIDSRTYRATVLVAVGPIKARFNLVVAVTEESHPESILSATRGEEGTRASILHAENVVTLAELPPERTEVYYKSDVTVTGRLAKFGLGVMKKKVDSLGAEFAERFRRRLDAATAAAP
jgi:uncharacterized protein